MHEVHLDRFFFTKEAQIRGESSYDRHREKYRESPMKNELSAEQITIMLYKDAQHTPFLNEKVIKFKQT